MPSASNLLSSSSSAVPCVSVEAAAKPGSRPRSSLRGRRCWTAAWYRWWGAPRRWRRPPPCWPSWHPLRAAAGSAAAAAARKPPSPQLPGSRRSSSPARAGRPAGPPRRRPPPTARTGAWPDFTAHGCHSCLSGHAQGIGNPLFCRALLCNRCDHVRRVGHRARIACTLTWTELRLAWNLNSKHLNT